MITKNIPNIIIAGPTASGKTKLSIELAKKIRGEIINADIMQMYKGFEILKAVPSKEEKSDVKHHLFGVINNDTNFTVANWIKLAQEKIYEIHKKQNIPILVGGTGMYLNAALEGLAEIPPISKIHREKAVNYYNKKGFDYIFKKLLKIDKNFKIEKNDRQRLIRAYEVYLQTGKSIKWWQSNLKSEPIIKNSLKVIISPPREELYSCIDKRVDIMLEKGLIEEAKKEILNIISFDLPSMKAIGIKFLYQYLNNEIDHDNAVNLIKKESRRYAKRQSTWFRNSFSCDLNYNKIYTGDSKFTNKAFKALNLLYT